jgi:uncharacterized protein (TIGR03083 family)
MPNSKLQTWQERLHAARQELLTLLTSLTPDQWRTPVFGEGETWTVATVVAHLAEGERGMSIHVHKIRKGEPTLPDNFDLNRWNAGVAGRVGETTPEELLTLLASTRTKTLAVMNSLSDEEWSLSGRHPSRGVITIEQYYETMAGHDLGHANDIRKAIEKG